jgi:hypothetical protein
MPASGYLDADVAYLLGLLVARGEMVASENVFRTIVHFPKGSLQARGLTARFDTDREIQLGMVRVRERLLELLGGDVSIEDAGEHWDRVGVHLIAWGHPRPRLGWRCRSMPIWSPRAGSARRSARSYSRTIAPMCWSMTDRRGERPARL